jgi:hypothetical protein
MFVMEVAKVLQELYSHGVVVVVMVVMSYLFDMNLIIIISECTNRDII